MTLLEEIEKIVGDNGIIFGEDVFNRKAGIWIDDGIRADAIVRPKNTEELSKVLSIFHPSRTFFAKTGSCSSFLCLNTAIGSYLLNFKLKSVFLWL